MDAKDEFFTALYKDDVIQAQKILLEKNMHGDLRDTNVGSNGVTALGVVVNLGDHAFAKTLIARGAKVDAIGAGVQAIHLASTPACVQLLVEHGANINAQTEEGPLLPTGTTPLMNAINNSKADVFNTLMALEKIDITLEDAEGRNAISHAAGRAIPEMHQALIARKEGRPDILVPLSDIENNTIRPVAAVEQPSVEQSGPVVEAVQSGQENEDEADKGDENTIRPVVAGASQALQADAIRPVGGHVRAGAETHEKGGDAAVQQPILNTLLRGRFIRDEAGIYRRQGEKREALADEGAQIRFIDKQMDTFEAGVELAKAKGWKAIEVTGTEKFRSEAWFHAKAAGLDVVGYEPNEADLKRLDVYSQKGIDKAGDKSINVSPASQNVDQSERLKALVESKAAAEEFAFDKKMGVQGVNPSRGRYSGNVLHETEHHIVQEIGRGTAVVHNRDDLDAGYKELLKSSKSLRIHYDQGKGKTQAAEKERGFGLGR